MKIICNLYLIIIKLFFFCNIKSTTLDFHRIIKTENLYQVTPFISRNHTTEIANMNLPLLFEFPSVIYSFPDDRQKLSFHDKNLITNVHSLQESLIIFYTSDLDEIRPFIDFLLPKLSVRQRPKCLVILYMSNSFDDKNAIDVIDALKYAWKKKFLDFSVMVMTNFKENPIYYLNPFNDIIYKKDLKERNIEVFPDKFRNRCNRYPFRTPDIDNSYNLITHTRKQSQKVKIKFDSSFAVSFTAEILNLNVVTINYTIESSGSTNFLEEWNLDVDPEGAFGGDYSTSFLVPTDESPKKVVAFVPIIPTSKIDVFLKFLCNFAIILLITFTFLLAYNRFKTAVGHIRVFDIIKVLLGQSIKTAPQKIAHKIIVLTVITTSFIMMNKVLSDVLSIMFEKRELPFETYKDLHDSGLQTYTNQAFLTQPRFLEIIDDPYLLKVLNRTIVVDEMPECLSTLKNWKNVSCIMIPHEPDLVITRFQSSDGSPTMKIACPPVYTIDLTHYWFSDGSPYAIKFTRLMQRIKETQSMHWPALVHENPRILSIEAVDVISKMCDRIKSEYLLVILSIGFGMSVISFIIELVTSSLLVALGSLPNYVRKLF